MASPIFRYGLLEVRSKQQLIALMIAYDCTASMKIGLKKSWENVTGDYFTNNEYRRMFGYPQLEEELPEYRSEDVTQPWARY